MYDNTGNNNRHMALQFLFMSCNKLLKLLILYMMYGSIYLQLLGILCLPSIVAKIS